MARAEPGVDGSRNADHSGSPMSVGWHAESALIRQVWVFRAGPRRPYDVETREPRRTRRTFSFGMNLRTCTRTLIILNDDRVTRQIHLLHLVTLVIL